MVIDLSQGGVQELVVLLDYDGQARGTMPKAFVHSAETPLHSAFSFFLFNKEGQVLAQRRAWSKRTWPGVWSNTCCGHPAPGESPEEAVTRKLEFELGLRGVDVEMILPTFRYCAEKDGIVENEVCPVLVGVTALPLEPVVNPEEVAETRWIPWSVFLSTGSDKIVGDFRELSPWSVLEAPELYRSPKFNEYMRQKEVKF